MPAACGIACEVCTFTSACGGVCFPGTDPRSPKRLEQMRRDYGYNCGVLECAINKRLDYCFQCDEFPCDIHCKVRSPFSKGELDFFKRNKDKQKK